MAMPRDFFCFDFWFGTACCLSLSLFISLSLSLSLKACPHSERSSFSLSVSQHAWLLYYLLLILMLWFQFGRLKMMKKHAETVCQHLEPEDDNEFKCKTCYRNKFYKTFLWPVIYTPYLALTHISILDLKGLFCPVYSLVLAGNRAQSPTRLRY